MVAEKKSAIVMGHPVVTSQMKTGNSKNNNNNNNCGSTSMSNKKVNKKPILQLPPPPMPKIPQIASENSRNNENNKFLQFVGPSCGHHASYTFYKAIKYVKNGHTKILSLGEFFFVKIWPNSDLVAIGELQLLWDDKNTNQTLSSLRLYFLPEYTPDGRMHYHGEDEIVAVSEKAVLRVSDLLDWIASPKEIHWDRGLKGICEADCQPLLASEQTIHQYDKGLNAKFSPGHSEFLADVRQEKEAIGDIPDLDDKGVIIINTSQYTRYRSVLKRVQGVEKNWMHNSLVVSLGGFTTPTRKTHILYCREIFDYAELEEHPYLCNHLAPKLKGRPRKRKKIKRPGSPESESASSESSASTTGAVSVASTKSTSKNGIKKDLLIILSQKNTKEESEFLKKLISFMECRNTPIERPPMLGYKQIDLHLFFEKVAQSGGYDGCMSKKAWKYIYDDLGGNPQNTSAATCTRRHYEKFLLPYERHTNGLEEKQIKRSESESGSEKSPASSIDLSTKSPKLERLKSESEKSEEAVKSEDTVIKSDIPVELDDPEQSEDETEVKSEIKSVEPIEEIKSKPEPPAQIAAADLRQNRKSLDKSDLRQNRTSLDKSGPSRGDKSNHHILDQVKNLMGNSKSDSQMKIDPEGKQLQIDDLIIIPNNMTTPHPEGGSALQNLAKIASRYQNSSNSGNAINKDIKELDMSTGHASAAKKPRLEEPLTQAPPSTPMAMPPKPSATTTTATTSQSLAALTSMNPMAMTPAQQQSLFAMLQPGLFMPPKAATPSTPGATSSATPSSKTAMAALFSPFAASLGTDPSKLDPEAMKLLQMFDSTLKAAVGAASQATPTTTGHTHKSSSSSPKPRNASGSSSAASSPCLLSAKDRDRNKITRLPADAKRPPSLQGHSPCAFAQTSTIYTNPYADLTKAKESATSTNSSSSVSDGALDLTSNSLSGRGLSRRLPPPHLPAPSTLSLGHDPRGMASHAHQSSTKGLNLRKESSLKAPPPISHHGMMDLSSSSSRQKNEGVAKVSPFSTEALLSKSSSVLPSRSRTPSSQQPPQNFISASGSKKAMEDSHRATPPRASPAPLAPSGNFSRPLFSPQTSTGSSATSDKSRTSPWHTPMTSASVRPVNTSVTSAAIKPAIPVSPVVREDKNKTSDHLSFQAALLGLGAASAASPHTSVASSTPMSLPLPPSSYGNLSAAQQQSLAAAANPYLALAAASKQASQGLGTPPGFPSPLGGLGGMDPTSAYYAALYSQSLYGMSPYGAAAGMRGMPGFPPTTQASAAPPPVAPGMDLLALHAMMTRGAGAGAGAAANQMAAAAAAAANPYAGYMNHPGLSGLLGFPGFPPGSGGRKDP